MKKIVFAFTALSVFTLCGGSGQAQVVTGQLGSPGATTTIPGNQIPAPTPPFGGVIKETLEGSKTWWRPRIVPPKDAPNVLLIMTDDQGYGVSGTFGGVIPTPTLDALTAKGLRYTLKYLDAWGSDQTYPHRRVFSAVGSRTQHHSIDIPSSDWTFASLRLARQQRTVESLTTAARRCHSHSVEACYPVA